MPLLIILFDNLQQVESQIIIEFYHYLCKTLQKVNSTVSIPSRVGNWFSLNHDFFWKIDLN
jgi:hypothetical protein